MACTGTRSGHIGHITLPADLPVAVVIAQHIGEASALVPILARRTALPALWADDDVPLRRGQVVAAEQPIWPSTPPFSCAPTSPGRQ
ncbi:chemotaxis protein CheB [Nonomuraea polychroma]|uniref:chemotaxis protein CheB n=1 Tax=Nonomuraea polychroma TaxID=46176 RepID=UPI003D94CE7D